MNAMWDHVIRSIAGLLDPYERDVALGDVAELRLSGGRAFAGMLGLVVRRQLQPWRRARPWLVLFGLVLPVATLLVMFSEALGMELFPVVTMWSHHRVVYDTGVTPTAQCTGWLVEAGAMMVASWALGFALAVLSRRTRFLLGLLFCIGILVGLNAPFAPRLILSTAILLVIAPAIYGVLCGARHSRVRTQASLVLTILPIVLGVLHAWVQGWYGAAMENWSLAGSALTLGDLIGSGIAWGVVIPSLFAIVVMALPGLCLLATETR